MIIIGIAATPSVAAKSVNLFKGDAKIQKNSLSLASNVTKSLSPTIVLSTITTTTNNNKEKENNTSILEAIDEHLASADVLKNAKKSSKWFTGEDLLKHKLESLPCLVDPILQKVGLACIAGASDTGKSAFLRQLCCAVVSGMDYFLDFRINAQYHSAIYVSSEDDEMAMRFLLGKQNLDWNIPEVQFSRLRFLFDTTHLMKDLESMLDESPADLVCIDAFGDLYDGDMNKSNQVRSFLNEYAQLAQRYKCLVIFLHHCGKRSEEEKTPSKHNLLGSQAFEAKMRLVLELRSDYNDNNIKHLCVVKGNYLSGEYKSESYDLLFSNNMTFSNTQDRTPFEMLMKTPGENHLSKKTEKKLERMKRAKKMVSEGYSYKEVAETEKVHPSAVSQWFKDPRMADIVI